jgi:hypothetical protein
MKDLRPLFASLDMMLTGKQKPLNHYQGSAKELEVDNVVYLADGGYSRLYGIFGYDDLYDFVVGSESTKRVKEAWVKAEVQALVCQICTEINEQNHGDQNAPK